MARDRGTIRHSADEIVAQPRVLERARRCIELAHELRATVAPFQNLCFDLGMIVECDDLRLDARQRVALDRKDCADRLVTLEAEHEKYRRERGEIRNRIETILANLETLDE